MGPVRFFVAAEAQARIDDDPVHAPAPSDSLDPRASEPWLLPHNSGEHHDVLGKVTVPLGTQQVVRFTGIVSDAQRLLFDPVLKYHPTWAPGSD